MRRVRKSLGAGVIKFLQPERKLSNIMEEPLEESRDSPTRRSFSEISSDSGEEPSGAAPQQLLERLDRSLITRILVAEDQLINIEVLKGQLTNLQLLENTSFYRNGQDLIDEVSRVLESDLTTN